MRRLSEETKIKKLKDYTQYTWEFVRRNPDYITDYQNFEKNAQEEAKNKGGAEPFLWDLDMMKKMIEKWGFLQDPKEASLNEMRSRQIAFIQPQIIKQIKTEYMQADKRHSFFLLALFLASMKLPGVIGINDIIGLETIKGIFNFDILGEKKVTLTIDLEAPAWIIMTSLDIIINALREGFEISEKRIPWDMLSIYLKIYDLKNEGKSLTEIAKEVYPVEYLNADEDGDMDHLTRKIRYNLKEAEKMVMSGKIM